MKILTALTQNRAEKQPTDKPQKRDLGDVFFKRKEHFLRVSRLRCLPVEWKSLQTKGQDTACLILDSEAKVSHRNSTEVQTMIVMRRGKWERGEWRRGEEVSDSMADQSRKIHREKIITVSPKMWVYHGFAVTRYVLYIIQDICKLINTGAKKCEIVGNRCVWVSACMHMCLYFHLRLKKYVHPCLFVFHAFSWRQHWWI